LLKFYFIFFLFRKETATFTELSPNLNDTSLDCVLLVDLWWPLLS